MEKKYLCVYAQVGRYTYLRTKLCYILVYVLGTFVLYVFIIYIIYWLRFSFFRLFHVSICLYSTEMRNAIVHYTTNQTFLQIVRLYVVFKCKLHKTGEKLPKRKNVTINCNASAQYIVFKLVAFKPHAKRMRNMERRHSRKKLVKRGEIINF